MVKEKVIIVGAGLIGASIAYRLAAQGADVTVVEAAQAASGASGHSFGWINASFLANEAHHQFRVQGIEAYRRLQTDLPELSVTWPGCLWWEEQGEGLERMQAQLEALGYPVERLDGRAFAARAPAIPAPGEALFFPSEGVVDAAHLTRLLLESASAMGARSIFGCAAEGIEVRSGRVAGLRIVQGVLPADHIVIAAGNGSTDLMAGVDVALPMLRRPGALLRTRAVPSILHHVMVSPDLEVRQDSAGRIIAPSSAAHQADNREDLADTPDRLADDTLMRLRTLLPGVDLVQDQIAVALRPVPGDGLPVVGQCGPDGLYLAVMHSGVTLGALIGELAAEEMLSGSENKLLTGYRPQRFSAC
ncbi:NAD(P)/FAD-dependent oxidoreductase [Roseovarius aestuarii]|uniref:4-methylaminobutanoate oxidase (Formaldehyde-forming) n=1 Tax=Roseovarius aestuarii TaxID=475083 RepID=A0A1X7BRG8_9RHOB|nr:FAD-dependent oxidoreductase [Roseovarius aestuarii]SMC12184.1 4-methylaminobutanoate oxidase (formaldehyde-forming) [Roseovarius aestuarii]